MFSKVQNKVLNFIPAFAGTREPPCGVNLGHIEPLNYPANYLVDEQFPIIDPETNETRLE